MGHLSRKLPVTVLVTMALFGGLTASAAQARKLTPAQSHVIAQEARVVRDLLGLENLLTRAATRLGPSERRLAHRIRAQNDALIKLCTTIIRDDARVRHDQRKLRQDRKRLRQDRQKLRRARSAELTPEQQIALLQEQIAALQQQSTRTELDIQKDAQAAALQAEADRLRQEAAQLFADKLINGDLQMAGGIASTAGALLISMRDTSLGDSTRPNPKP